MATSLSKAEDRRYHGSNRIGWFELGFKNWRRCEMDNKWLKAILMLTTILTVFALAQPVCLGQARSRAPRQSNIQRTYVSIRQVDFKNFTYHPSLCNQSLGIGATVRVIQGKYKNADAYFEVGEVIYGRPTEKDEWAVVHIGCGGLTANFGLSEVLIYAIYKGQVQLMESINDEDMEHDYRRYYPGVNHLLWRISGVRLSNLALIIEKFAGGPMACPTEIVTFNYEFGEGLEGLNTGVSRFDEYGSVNCGANPPVRGSNRMGNFSLYHTGCGAVGLNLNEQPRTRPAKLSCQ